ncbi:hypothetical protein [Kitasatospora sp. MAA19]|uniref:hypothetical protein n=1 Tax=Kitasatospora sp. MAA19 TaxID=3035090 RepID=UPI002474BDED|nr:hypothetical protein [Kitasatospora sp. MAA19]
MTFLAGTDQLPLRIERPFSPWSYAASHRTLVLRGAPQEPDAGLEIEFINVAAMKIRRGYSELHITRAGEDRPGIEEFADVPEEHRDAYHVLLLSDGDHQGFVMCSRMRISSLT